MFWSLVRVVLLCSLAVIGSSSRSVHNEPCPNQNPLELNAAAAAATEVDENIDPKLDEAELELQDVGEEHQDGSTSTSVDGGNKQVPVETDKGKKGSTNRDKVADLEGTNNSKYEKLHSGSAAHQISHKSHDHPDSGRVSDQIYDGLPPVDQSGQTRCMVMPFEKSKDRARQQQDSGGQSPDNLNGLKASKTNNRKIDKYWSCSVSELPRSSNYITHSQGCFSSFDTITHMKLTGDGSSLVDANQTSIIPENCVYCNKSKAMICSGSEVKQVPTFFGVADDLKYLIFDKTDILALDSRSIQNFPLTETLALLNGILFRVQFAPLLSRVFKEIVIVNNSLSGLNFSWFYNPAGNNTSTVTILNLMDNMITYLPDLNTGTELVLPNLQTVILSNNPLKVLPVHVFRPLRESQVMCLSLRSCCLEDFGSSVNVSSPLQYLTKLQTLDLSENFLFGTERLARLLTPLRHGNLSTLRISGNNYLYIPTGALQQVSHSLQELDLHSSSFSCIDLSSFPYMPKLMTLHLDYSRITSILTSAFSALPSLRSLTLEGNGLLSVPSAVRLPTLTHLSLSGNPRIEDSQGKCLFSLSQTSFTGMTNLTSLNMAETPLTALRSDQFAGLSALIELSLNATTLETIEPGSFRGLKNLQKLYLNNNILSKLMNGTFEGLDNLSVLDLSHNQVSFSNSLVIPVKSNIAPSITEDPSRRSKKVYLPAEESSANQTQLEMTLVDPRLENLSQSPNNNKTLNASAEAGDLWDIRTFNSNPTNEPDAVETSQSLCQNEWPFSDLTRLEILIMNDNKITGMCPVFDDLHNLTALDLGNNKIYEWQERLLSGCSTLRALNLKDNQIRTLTDAMVEDFNSASLEEINLISNHFECSCDLVPFVEVLNDEHFVGFEYYECSSGKSNLQLTTYLSEMVTGNCDSPEDTLGTVTDSVLMLGISLCALLLIGPFVFLINRVRRRKPVMVVSKTASSDHELETPFEYDVFVCYAFQEKQWVFQVLLPVFEQQLKLHVCIHERDFQAGDLITENIENSIKKSRKVLFVVSRAFQASQWCQYELSTALMLAINSNNSKLLLLEKEVIPKEEQSSMLQMLLRTRTFIHWSDDSEEQTIVWDKFRRVLVPKSRRPTDRSGTRSGGGGVTILRNFLSQRTTSTVAKGSSKIVPTHQTFRKLRPGENDTQKADVRMARISGKENLGFELPPIRPLPGPSRETGRIGYEHK